MSRLIDVIIAGGGPVGLYLAGRLLQMGLHCTVLEKRTEIDIHSKSLGIHPVSLELFGNAGIVDAFLDKGLKIKKGIAFWNRDRVGEIRFEHCPEPFKYILALPQWQTETILEDWVLSLDETAILRGAEITGLDETEASVTVTYNLNGEKKTLEARYLAGCDGKNSTIRTLKTIPFEGRPYPDTYIMGDFEDNTGFGADAVVYLHQQGLIESFPLPGGQRRWVVKTDEFVSSPEPELIADVIKERLGHSLTGIYPFMMSSFGVQHYMAETFHNGKTLLAGDAAHVVSPIGGQGMNLGWLDAEMCSTLLGHVLEHPEDRDTHFKNYSASQTNIAKQVARRAEINMWLGRKESSGLAVRLLVNLMIRTPASRLLARLFTMRGLGTWPV